MEIDYSRFSFNDDYESDLENPELFCEIFISVLQRTFISNKLSNPDDVVLPYQGCWAKLPPMKSPNESKISPTNCTFSKSDSNRC